MSVVAASYQMAYKEARAFNPRRCMLVVNKRIEQNSHTYPPC